jgi:hypothetical protein
MKILILALLCFGTMVQAETQISISEIDQYNIVCTIIGNEKSTHYDKPIVIELINQSKEDIQIAIPVGTIFEAVDSTVQDMVIFENYNIIVDAGNTEIFSLRGMCIESHNRAPRGDDLYGYSARQDRLLNQTIRFLNENSFSQATAQEAVWTVINRPEFIELSGWNANEINETSRFLAQLLDLPTPELVRDNDERLYSAPPRRAKVSANFSFYFPEETDVRVALFDLDGIMQRELYIKENARPGEYVVSFSFDGTPYIGQMYQCKLIADGEVRLVRDLDLR